MARHIQDLLLKGQQVLIAGKKGSYVVDRAIKSIVFKGYIQGTSTPVMIKTEGHPVLFKREVNVYGFDCIKESPNIRAMYETVDNGTDKCMVFEWMEDYLWSLRHQKGSLNSALPKTVAKSVLQALAASSDMDGQGAGVHTDVNPNNILVSGADSSSPTVKLADLENLIPAGKQFEYRLQGLAIRAPEIWMGGAISTACDVWTVGVSLAHFLAARPLFGPSGVNIQIESKSDQTTQAACSIGKIIQLVGLFPWDKDPKYREEFDPAKLLVKKGLIKNGSLEAELLSMEVPQDCVEFIRYLLALDPHERPTAEQTQKHPWLQSAA